MKVALINIIQHRQLAKKEFAPDRYFNPIIDEMGNILITEWEIEGTENADFLWVKDLPLVEHSDILNPPDTTPPASNGYGIEIPQEFIKFFDLGPINLNGFIVELKTHSSGKKYCESSILNWTAFREEANKPQNTEIMNALRPLWFYGQEQYQSNNLLQL